MTHDPYTNTQTKFLRADPTGRWSPIHEQKESEQWWVSILGGMVIALCISLVLVATI